MRNEKKLDYFCILSIILTVLDLLTTVFCLHYFPDKTQEGNPAVRCIIESQGLYVGFIFMTLFWVGWSILLRYTTLPIWVSICGFLSVIVCRLVAVANNSYVIFRLLT